MIVDGAEVSARAWLELTKWRYERMGFVATLMDEGGETHGGGGASASGGTTGDPTARKAMGRMEQDERLSWEYQRLERDIGQALGVIDGARRALGDQYADTIDAYYLTDRRVTWPNVAELMGCAVSTCYLRRDVFCDWLEDVGLDGAIEGRFV